MVQGWRLCDTWETLLKSGRAAGRKGRKGRKGCRVRKSLIPNPNVPVELWSKSTCLDKMRLTDLQPAKLCSLAVSGQ